MTVISYKSLQFEIFFENCNLYIANRLESCTFAAFNGPSSSWDIVKKFLQLGQ